MLLKSFVIFGIPEIFNTKISYLPDFLLQNLSKFTTRGQKLKNWFETFVSMIYGIQKKIKNIYKKNRA